jgi:RNA polymerase sigma factor (sigma-70 family)
MTDEVFDASQWMGERPAGRPVTGEGGTGGGFDGSDWDRFYAFCDGAIRTALASRPLQPADREDCRQEIWMELLATRMSRFRGGDLRSWLAALARNKAVDAVRRSRRRPVGLAIDPETRPAGPFEGPCAADESRSLVWSALAALERRVETRSFLVFFLRWIEGWSFIEIAAHLGLTPEQARLRHHRTKEKFRQVILDTAPRAERGDH